MTSLHEMTGALQILVDMDKEQTLTTSETKLTEDVAALRRSKERQRIQPELNKLFKNRIRGMIDERVALKNLESTKQKMEQDYGMPANSKVYNFLPVEIRRMMRILNYQFPDNHAKQLGQIDDRMSRRAKGLGLFLSVIIGYSLGMRFGSKWSRLTCGSTVHYTFLHYITVPGIAYILLDHMEDDISLMFKYHSNYELMINKYESI